jgi:SAM-dependent methyltransferase
MVDGRHLMHSTPAPVSRCKECGSIFRDPDALPADVVTKYADDEYGDAELERLYRRGVAAYGSDWTWLRTHGLEPGARVLEIGSYVGALLSYLRRAGCDAIGIDVGREVSEFARAQGVRVRTGVFDPDDFPAQAFHAVVVLNCFEQLPDPRATLDGIRRVLRLGGTLVVRTPNADFAAAAHLPWLRPVAAANGILGMPFVRCFSASALSRVVMRHGFLPKQITERPWMDLVARKA